MKLKTADSQVYKLIKNEEKRQKTSLQMIPSENFASEAVREAVGSVLMNKYSEGYPGKRYYQGNEFIDQIETIAIERAKKVFGVPHANVQPLSGSPANSAVYFALLEPGDTIMGMALSFGGHLTHGHPKITFSGKYFKSVQYGTDEHGFIDYAEVEKLALTYKPKLIISGSTAYPRAIDFKKFGEIADKIGAWHMADISHIAGLVASGVHQSPVKYADIVTTTTHKTLRGPRGAIIMTTLKGIKKDPELASKIDRAVFPGWQGGPHENTIAGIAVCLKEVSSLKYVRYAKQVVANAKALGNELKKYSFNVVSGGTDNHLLLVDLSAKGIDGWCVAWALEYAGIVVNRNAVPFDKKSAFLPSGIRLGTPAITTAGFKEKDMVKIAKYINEVVEIAKASLPKDINSTDVLKARLARTEFKKTVKSLRTIVQINKKVKILL